MDPKVLLTQEHRFLMEKFDFYFLKLKNIPEADLASVSSELQQAWHTLLSLCKNDFEENHHRKEEVLLFAAVRDNPRITAGGPMCTIYFDSHMFFTTMKVAQNLSKKILGQELYPQWTEDLLLDRKSNSPLTIPGEDHEASRILIRLTQDVLKKPFDLSLHVSLKEIFQLYREIQASHFQREENCFFVMCQSLIPQKDWLAIGEAMSTRYKFLA